MKIMYVVDYPTTVKGIGIAASNEYIAETSVKGGDQFDLKVGKEVVKNKLKLQQLNVIDRVTDDKIADANFMLKNALEILENLMERKEKIQSQKEEILAKLKEY
ncbi:MAG: hypothetical protein M0R38_13055 [Bacteroidia bacterium]|nr:hypothetical protein [Bacteroidia bacterium]